MFTIRSMSTADYDAVMGLLAQTPGMAIRSADSRAATALYLDRNPGLSLVAEGDGRMVGCLMCGHDGRRGYLQHLAVLPESRRQGIATALIETCLDRLAALGIFKSHLDVFADNKPATAFWKNRGWELRDDLERFSFINGADENA